MQISWCESDFIEIDLVDEKIQINVNACSQLEALAKKIDGLDLKSALDIAAKLGFQHEELLIKEALLKLSGSWDYPYKEEEVCHCRMIPTKVVDAAIVGGIQDVKEIGRFCSAGITCGNCSVDIENMISYRKKNL